MATTTKIISKNADYFLADLDDGGIRFGHMGGFMMEMAASHKLYESIRAMDVNSDEFEEMFCDYYIQNTPAVAPYCPTRRQLRI